jgi:hypothetical protein
MVPGRKEIREEVFQRLKNHPKLLANTTARQLTTVVMSNIGWGWDVEDVGRTPIHVGTIYEDDSAIAGLESFVEACMLEFKQSKEE